MRNFAFGGALYGASYVDYLKLSAADAIAGGVNETRLEVSDSARRIIATREQLHQEQLAVLGKIDEGLQEISGILFWGFTELIASIGRVHDQLEELIRAVKTPEQTWAYEQFEIARTDYRRKLYPEALEALNRAINGSGPHLGYKEEHRFYYLTGLIRLGSFECQDKEIVDLKIAEEMFVKAARYALSADRTEAARTLAAAGWAAYCQGKIPQAYEYTEQALRLTPDFAEANFQKAKVLMHQGKPDEGFQWLEHAIEIDRNYSIRAAADDDFVKYEPRLTRFLEGIAKRKGEEARQKMVVIENAMREMEQAGQAFSIAYAKYSEEDDSKKAVRSFAEKAKQLYAETLKAYNSRTLFGYIDTIARAQETISAAKKATSYSAYEQEKEIELTLKKTALHRARWGLVCGIIGFFFPLLGPVSLYFGLRATSELSVNDDGRGSAEWAIWLGVFECIMLIGLAIEIGLRK